MMKCPFCDEDMTKGVFMPTRDGSVMYWVTEAYEKQHSFPPYTKKGLQEARAVKIHTGFGLTHPADPFWLCRKCGRLIGEIQLPENEQS